MLQHKQIHIKNYASISKGVYIKYLQKKLYSSFHGVILSGFTFESSSRLEEQTYNEEQN